MCKPIQVEAKSFNEFMRKVLESEDKLNKDPFTDQYQNNTEKALKEK
jgi:hypothetical protein